MKTDVAGKNLKVGQTAAISTKLKGAAVIRVGQIAEVGESWIKLRVLGRMKCYYFNRNAVKIERFLILTK